MKHEKKNTDKELKEIMSELLVHKKYMEQLQDEITQLKNDIIKQEALTKAYGSVLNEELCKIKPKHEKSCRIKPENMDIAYI